MRKSTFFSGIGFLVVLFVLFGQTGYADSYGEAVSLNNAKKHQEAEAMLTRLIAKEPANASLYSVRAHARIGLGNKMGASADYDDAIRIEPENKTFRSSRAAFRMNHLKDYPGAVVDYTEVVRLGPKNAYDAYCRSQALLKAGYLPEALAEMDRSIAIKESGYVHAARGQALEQLGRGGEARIAYQRALELDPKNSVAGKGLESLAAGGGKTPVKTNPAVPLEVLLRKAPEVSPDADALKRRVFRLVNIEMPLADRKLDFDGRKTSYEGKGRSAGFTFLVEEQGTHTGHIRWTLPSEIVPGKPANIGIEGVSGDNYTSTFGYVSLSGPSIEEIPLAGVRVTQNPYRGPDVRKDEFDLVIPDVSRAPEEFKAGQGDRKTLLRLRNREKLGAIVNFGPSSSDKTPTDVPVEEYAIPLSGWLQTNGKEMRDIRLTVYYSNTRWPIARYTYRCVESVPEGIEIVADNQGPASILPDGRDGIFLKARAKPRADKKPPSPEATTNIVFSGEGPGADWIDLSESEVRDGWKVVFVRASNPDAARGTYAPPEFLTISAQSTDNDVAIGGQFRLWISPNPVIDVDQDKIEYSAKSGTTSVINAWIHNSGSQPWSFRAEYVERHRPLCRVSIKTTGNNTAELTLTEAGLDPESGAVNEVVLLRVLAEQPGRDSLERHVKIIVGQEGVFAVGAGRDPEGGYYRVIADGQGKTTDVDFRIFLFDAKKNRLVNQPELAGNLKIESLESEESVAAQVIKLGQCKWEYAGTRAGNDPTGIIRFSMPKEIPGDGRVIKSDFKATFPGRAEEQFTAIFSIGFVTATNGPGSAEWVVEVKRCEEIIGKFVPPAYHLQMVTMLEKRKQTLGVEGLRALRERIWHCAVELTLGEGGKGYANEAAWADHITVTLEWAEWAGDMAFGAVIGVWTGPYGATGASMLKTAVISALRAYQEGQSPDEWLWENICTIPGIIEGKIIDVDTFEKMGVNNKAKAWAIFIGYHFCKNLYNGATLVDALKNTAKEAGRDVLSGWLSQQARRSVAQTPVTAPDPAKPVASGDKTAKPFDAPAPKPAEGEPAVAAAPKPSVDAKPAESVASQQIRKNMTMRDNKTYASQEDVLAVMRDPSQVRSLKNASPEVQQAFSNTREAIYRQHDDEVVRHVKENNPDLKYRMVKVMEFRTPGKDGPSLNTDRDYRLCYYAGRDPQTGKEQWIEIDRRKWEEKSHQTFARLTGGPGDDPKSAREWAAKHQQLATDKSHMEASPDFADQARLWNPQTRKFENAQIVPQILRVKAGQQGSSLKDPQALGRMYQVKVADAHFKHEALVQAQKAVNELAALRKGYEDQERNVGRLPKSVSEGMQAIITANERLAADPNRRDPKAIAAAEKQLRENGFRDLADFMEKLTGQFEALKFATKE